MRIQVRSLLREMEKVLLCQFQQSVSLLDVDRAGQILWMGEDLPDEPFNLWQWLTRFRQLHIGLIDLDQTVPVYQPVCLNLEGKPFIMEYHAWVLKRSPRRLVLAVVGREQKWKDQRYSHLRRPWCAAKIVYDLKTGKPVPYQRTQKIWEQTMPRNLRRRLFPLLIKPAWLDSMAPDSRLLALPPQQNSPQPDDSDTSQSAPLR